MKLLICCLLPLMLLAESREACTRMVEEFASVEAAYDAVVQSGVAAPASEAAIRRFKKEGAHIYEVCKDKMSTTAWYMLGKKVRSEKVKSGTFHLESPEELRRYAITHPPVRTVVHCGSVRQGIHLRGK